LAGQAQPSFSWTIWFCKRPNPHSQTLFQWAGSARRRCACLVKLLAVASNILLDHRTGTFHRLCLAFCRTVKKNAATLYDVLLQRKPCLGFLGWADEPNFWQEARPAHQEQQGWASWPSPAQSSLNHSGAQAAQPNVPQHFCSMGWASELGFLATAWAGPAEADSWDPCLSSLTIPNIQQP
jgi:hypothetical protein